MPLGRKELKDKFGNPTAPTKADYGLLIDASLNRNEDKFYGIWKPDMPYSAGAVVFHDKTKSFFQLNPNLKEPYCNATTLDCDPNWCKIGSEDEDWRLSGSFMYANEAAKCVGIGTTKPTATFQVEAHGKGEIRLEPTLDDPTIRIVNHNPECDKNEMALITKTETTDVETNAPNGIRLIKKEKEKPVKQTKGVVATQTIASFNVAGGEPRVGIGTETPSVHLQVGKSEKTHVKVDGNTPSVSLQTANDKGDNMLVVTLGETEAAFITDSKGGFQFKQKEKDTTAPANKAASTDYEETPKGDSKPPKYKLRPLVTFADNGNVGIATTEPNTVLHVASPNEDTRAKDGTIKAGFCNTYPVVQLVNYRLNEKPNYSLIATENQAAIWMTDSGCFAFRRGNPLSDTESLASFKLSNRDAVRIFTDGKVLIGEKLQKDEYELDVDGAARACGFFIETDRSRIDEDCIEELTGEYALKSICDSNLRPIRFHWNGKRCKDTNESGEFGLIADELANVFPEVVKTSSVGDCTQSVAYQNLVPVLIRAIQQQQELIQQLQRDVADLQDNKQQY